MAINEKNQEVLEAHIKIIENEPRKHNFGILKDLAQEVEDASRAKKTDGEHPKLEGDEDQRLFFGDEFCDSGPSKAETKAGEEKSLKETSSSDRLIEYEKDFEEFMGSASLLLPSQLLMDDSLFNTTSAEVSNVDLLGALQIDQKQDNCDLLASKGQNSIQLNKNPSKKANDISKWFSLFSDLDPLNQQTEQDDASKNLHAA